jgi:hypothetical protein
LFIANLFYSSFPRFKSKGLSKRAYQSILSIALTFASEDLTYFYKNIREHAKQRFNIPYHSKIIPLIPAKAAYLYDAVMLYARAATKALYEKVDLRDGKKIMEKYIFNRTFTSRQGFEV